MRLLEEERWWYWRYVFWSMIIWSKMKSELTRIWLGQMMRSMDDITCCHEHHVKPQPLSASELSLHWKAGWCSIENIASVQQQCQHNRSITKTHYNQYRSTKPPYNKPWKSCSRQSSRGLKWCKLALRLQRIPQNMEAFILVAQVSAFIHTHMSCDG